MVQTAETAVNEKSTAMVTLNFTQEDGVTPATPKTLYITVTDLTGNSIKARTQITSGLASEMDIELSGNDLAVPPDGEGFIVLLAEATYDSSKFGNDRPLNDEYRIPHNDLIGLS